MRSSATTYLRALAFADSMYLLCACLFYSPRPLTWLSTDRDPDFQVRERERDREIKIQQQVENRGKGMRKGERKGEAGGEREIGDTVV